MTTSILGTCNPHLAQKALHDEPDLGLLLPCNVVVRRGPADSSTVVQAIDPDVMSRLSTATAVAEVAADAQTRLRAALEAIAETEQP